MPLAMLAPDSLVWKLAGRVQAAAAGEAPHANHTFVIPELSSLFDQILIQLQDFPAPPEQYRPQENEPQLDSSSRIRIVSGFSGAGKKGAKCFWVNSAWTQKSPVSWASTTTPPVRRSEPRMSVKTSIVNPSPAFRSIYPAAQSFWQTAASPKDTPSPSRVDRALRTALIPKSPVCTPKNRKGEKSCKILQPRRCARFG